MNDDLLNPYELVNDLLNPFIEHPAQYRQLHGGDQWIFTFPNGYGASVVRHGGSYGSRTNLWELAVLDQNGICYSTPITDDVIGWLSIDAVRELLRKVGEL